MSNVTQVVLFFANHTKNPVTGVQSFTWSTHKPAPHEVLIENEPIAKGKSKLVFKATYDGAAYVAKRCYDIDQDVPISIAVNRQELVQPLAAGNSSSINSRRNARQKKSTSQTNLIAKSTANGDRYRVKDFEVTGFIVAREGILRLTTEAESAKTFVPSPAAGIRDYETLSKEEKDELSAHTCLIYSVTWLLEFERGNIEFRKAAILMPFEALGEDILLSILCFCDVYTILAVSAINKPLRGVTLSKQLWVSIVQDSAFRAALELPPPDQEDLENQSTEELIDFVKNAVVGPGSLFNDRSSATMIHTTYKIPLHDLGDGLGAQLLPGARYILLQNTTREKVYIYDVWNARRIWQCRVQVDTICKVDLVPGGAIARVLLVQPMNYPNKNRLHIEEVDLISGISRQVFELGCPQYLVISSLAKYDIVGDFFLCSMQDSRVWPKFILINWQTSAFIDLGNGLNFALVLIPGYVVWTDYPSHEQQILTVTALDQFSNYWQPLSDARLPAQLSSGDPPIPNIVRERLAYSNHPLGSCSVGVHLTVTPSALYHGAYNISVQAGESPEPPTLIGKIGNLVAAQRRSVSPVVHEALLSYKFRPAPSHSQACELRLVSAQRVSHTTQRSSLRAVAQWSGGSAIVSYLQRKGPPMQYYHLK
ncbi:hypothetical protein C8R45DRAFT_1218215 [Mycena sanguinolenta]|nr:hypothetical protein C8R45DRAFT_1218215 [Mycena sanguinolenta]